MTDDTPGEYLPADYLPAEAFEPDFQPLAHLDAIQSAPTKPVLIVEGEPAVRAATGLFPSWVVCTWRGGERGVETTLWGPLRGRDVVIWPDNDDSGLRAAIEIGLILHGKATRVRVLDVTDQPPGWNAVDAIVDGWTPDRVVSWCREMVSEFTPPDAANGHRAAPEPPPRLPKSADASQPDEYTWGSLGLAMTKNGKEPLMNLDNVVRIIEADPEISSHIWYDDFLDAIVTDWQGPERKWTDADDIKLQLYCQRHVGLHKIGSGACRDAALVSAFHHRRNECREWLESLEWDGEERLEWLFSRGFGAEQNEYSAATSRCWIVSMVARVMVPGCKVDTVPVLEGGQGVKKSTALAIIGGKWFVECHESVLSKDFYEVLRGHMLVEISEMHSFTRAEVERVKGIISCQMDRYRKAYGRHTEDHPRQTVLACTTNKDDWQRDETGARRFWPIACTNLDHDWLTENRDQLFAEAVARYKRGEPWWDVPVDLQRAEVDARRESDSWEPIIEEWLMGRDRFLMHELLSEALRIDPGKQDQLVQKRAGRILRILGWVNRPLRDHGNRVRKHWVREIDVT